MEEKEDNSNEMMNGVGGNILRTNLYLVRHAHSVYTPDEFERPLSDKGFADAKRVTKRLIPENIEQVISSPYKRAIQTVEGIAKHLDQEVEIIVDYRERTLTREPAVDFEEAITKVWVDPSFSWEGGESNIVAQQRGVAITLELLDRYAGKNIVVGTHGNLMVLVMNYFDQQYGFDFWKQLDMPDIYRLRFERKELVGVERVWGK